MIKILHRIVSITGKYKKRIRAAYLCSFLKGITMKAPLILCFLTVSAFMDGSMTKRKCLYVGIAMVASVILTIVFEHINNVLQSSAGYKVFADMRMQLGNHLRKLPMGYYTEGNIGKISSVLATDMVFIEENCMGVLSELVSFLISQTLMVTMMFFMDWRLGILALVVTGVFVLIGNGMLKNTSAHSKTKQECCESLTEEVLDFAEGIGIVKSYNLLGERSKRLTEEFEKSCKDSISFEIDYTPWARALNLCFGIGTSLLLALAAFLHNSGEISDIYMVGMALFLFDMFIAIKSYYGQMARLTVTEASLDRIEEVMHAREMPDEGTFAIEESVDSPEIEYEHVTFGYTDKTVLHDVSFAMEKGSMTALVGPSGGGKSTVASLLARFWDVQSGSIMVKGRDIRTVPMGQLMDQIGMVFQRVYLFQDTVYNNIAMAKPDASREEVMEAAKKARCYDFVMKLPQGFDTVIGEGGASLSGGEQQRVSIARCILKDAPIVILDEATASVDADNERAIQEAISELCRDKTLLVIAHRLKTIRDADQILVITDGKIAEQGTHESLMAAGGIYARMVSLQTA